MKTLYALDGNNLICRACFSPAPALRSADGVPTKGPFILLKTLMKLVRERKPDYLVVALDSPRKSLLRRKLYPGYKASREGKPHDPDLEVQFKLCLEMLRTLGLPLVSAEGYEADDVIATVLHRFASPPYRVSGVAVSADKDLHQVVSSNVTCLDPFTSTVWDADAVRDRWCVEPRQVIDVQALAGDPTDGVPGVPGVGLKTAIKMVQQAGSALGAWKGRDSFPKGWCAKLSRVTEADVRLMTELVRLDWGAPVAVGRIDSVAFGGIDLERGRALFNYLGFRQWSALRVEKQESRSALQY